MFVVRSIALVLLCFSVVPVSAQDRFALKDVFELEFASDPQISVGGGPIVFVRNFFDVMKDRKRSNLWIINHDGSKLRPLTTGNRNDVSPRWSPDRTRIAYVSNAEDGSAQIYCRWMDTGTVARLTQLPSAPSGLSWSPDGKYLAFSMFVEKKVKPLVKLPTPPKGAKWAALPKEIRKTNFRFDGKGYLKDGFSHYFLLSAEGGTARQLTSGPYHHRGEPQWTPDSKYLIFSGNRNKNWEFQPRESEIYELNVANKEVRQLTKHKGPDINPAVSPDGKWIAFSRFDNRYQGFQSTRLHKMKRDGSEITPLGDDTNTDATNLVWSAQSQLFYQFDDHGVTCVASLKLRGSETKKKIVAKNVGGTTIGRPYASGSFSAKGHDLTYTLTSPTHPADVACYSEVDLKNRRLTNLNKDLFDHIKLGTLEEINYKSTHDGRKLQGWILKPPGFNPKKKYPLILEIHGGPFANYGPRFSAEMQLYAAKGYVVFYANPRGSTSYGEEFANLIHHKYPDKDYDDLMDGVDAVIKKGYIDEKNLFVTGGSGGGVLSAWIVGMTNRFRAAVVCKPVINWFSFVLSADMYVFFRQYWFPAAPWEDPEHYYKRSPISKVGNVKTPTMLITGEQDYRTPMSETEQFFHALKLQKIDSVLVRIPGASHNIAARPSQMIAKVAYVLYWFEKHKK